MRGALPQAVRASNVTGAAARAPAPCKLLVVGIGNPDRGDDAFGALVVQALDGRLPSDVPAIECRGDVLGLIEDWSGCDGLVCIDAAAPLGSPGRILRIDLDTGPLPGDLSGMSSHEFGLAQAIGLARSLELAPRRIIVYAVEAGSFGGGAPPSPAVAAAVPIVADRIVIEIQRLRDL